jgi:hypothetical protein
LLVKTPHIILKQRFLRKGKVIYDLLLNVWDTRCGIYIWIQAFFRFEKYDAWRLWRSWRKNAGYTVTTFNRFCEFCWLLSILQKVFLSQDILMNMLICNSSLCTIGSGRVTSKGTDFIGCNRFTWPLTTAD